MSAHRHLIRVASPILLGLLASSFGRAQCADALLEPRAELVAVSIGSTALFAGGSWTAVTERVELYDAASGTWSSAVLGERRARLAAAVVGSRAYFGGGGQPNIIFQFQASPTVDVYDAASGTWSSDQLSEGRWSLAAAAAGDQVIFAGGFRTSVVPGIARDTVDVLHVPSGTWTTTVLSVARGALAGAAVGDLALFAGGSDSTNTPPLFVAYHDRVDILDASTGQWSQAALSEPRAHLAGVAVGGRVLFAGGEGDGGASARVDIFDVSSGIWSTATLSEPRSHLAAFAVGTRAVFVGGWTDSGASAAIDVYDAATNLWSSATLAVGRADLAATAAGGVLLVAGGRVALGDPLYAIVDAVVGPVGSALGTAARIQAQSDWFGNPAYERFDRPGEPIQTHWPRSL